MFIINGGNFQAKSLKEAIEAISDYQTEITCYFEEVKEIYLLGDDDREIYMKPKHLKIFNRKLEEAFDAKYGVEDGDMIADARTEYLSNLL